MKIETPKRKIKPTRRSVSGVYSFRGLESVAYESTLERDFLVKQEFALDVITVVSQPMEIPYVDDRGVRRIYTPDYMVYYRIVQHAHMWSVPKAILVEVKPKEQWKEHWRLWKRKWKAAIRESKRDRSPTSGNYLWQFRIYDEDRIRDQGLRNIQYIERFKEGDYCKEECQWVMDNLRSLGQATVAHLLLYHFPGIYREKGKQLLWHLLANRLLECDIQKPLDEHLYLWVAQ